MLPVDFLKISQFLGTRVGPVKVNPLADSVEIYEKTNLSIELWFKVSAKPRSFLFTVIVVQQI